MENITGDQEIGDVATVAFYGSGSYEYFGEGADLMKTMTVMMTFVYYDDGSVALFMGTVVAVATLNESLYSSTTTATLSGSSYSNFGSNMSHGDVDGDDDESSLGLLRRPAWHVQHRRNIHLPVGTFGSRLLLRRRSCYLWRYGGTYWDTEMHLTWLMSTTMVWTTSSQMSVDTLERAFLSTKV